MRTRYQKLTSLTALLVLAAVILVPSFAHAAWLTPVYEVLTPPQSGSFQGIGRVVTDVWGYLMAAVNSLVFIMLIIVAFMNILRVQLDSYAVKKILPSFIMAVILANFSFLVCRIIIDFGNIAISIFLAGSEAGKVANPASATNTISGAFDKLLAERPPAPGSAENYYGLTASYIVKQIVILIGSGFVFALAFIFLVRNYYLYVLVAVSPLAFMAMFLPMTKKWFQQWWGQFSKWVFMPVTAVFWLWFAGLLIDEISKISGEGGWLLTSIAAIFCFYMAFNSALKFDKAVGTWYGWGKQAWGKTGGEAIKQGKWAVSGGAQGYAQAYYQMKAKRAGNLGRTAEKESYDRKAKVASYLNPQTYIKGYKERAAFGRSQAESAVFKSDLYARTVGGPKQIETMQEKTADDWRDASAFEAGEGMGGFITKLQSSNDARVQDFLRQRLRDTRKTLRALRNANADRIARGERELPVPAIQEIYADQIAKFMRTKSAVDKSAIFNKSDISVNDVAESKNIAGSWARRSGRQNRAERQAGLLSRLTRRPAGGAGNPSSAVPGQPGDFIDELEIPATANQVQQDAYSATRERLTRGRANAGLPATEERRGETQNAGAQTPPRPPDMSRVENLLEQILNATEKSTAHSEQLAANISKNAMAGTRAGTGDTPIREIRGRFTLENLSPVAKNEMGILQDRANQRAQIIRQRIETRQQDQQLRALRNISQNEEEIIRAAREGRRELETGQIGEAQE